VGSGGIRKQQIPKHKSVETPTTKVGKHINFGNFCNFVQRFEFYIISEVVNSIFPISSFDILAE
jgi:hypothetical protein